MKKDKETKLTEEEVNSLMRELQNIKTEDFADRAKIKERSDLLEKRDETDLTQLMEKESKVSHKKGGGFTYRVSGKKRTMSEYMKELLGGREHLEANFQGGGSISDIFISNMSSLTTPGMQQPMQQPIQQQAAQTQERGGLASKGRYGDTEMAYTTSEEQEILKSLGGSGTINPQTGKKEYWVQAVAQLLPMVMGMFNKKKEKGGEASKGRYGDTELVHVNKFEKELLKSLGGSGTTNPETGKKEYWLQFLPLAISAVSALTKKQKGGAPKRNKYQWGEIISALASSGGGEGGWMSMLSNLGGSSGGEGGGMDWMSMLKNINLGGGSGTSGGSSGGGGLGGLNLSSLGGLGLPPGPHSLLPYLQSWRGLSRYQSAPPNKDCIPRAGGGWQCPKGPVNRGSIVNWDGTVRQSPQSPFARHFAERGGHIYQTGGEPVKPVMSDFKTENNALNLKEFLKAKKQYKIDLAAWEEQQTAVITPTDTTVTTPVDTTVTDTTNVPVVEEGETGKRPIDKIFKPSIDTQHKRFLKAKYEQAKKILAEHPEARTQQEKYQVLMDNGMKQDWIAQVQEYSISEKGDDLFETSIMKEEVDITEYSKAREEAARQYTVGPEDMVQQKDGSYLPREGAISKEADRAIWKGDQWVDNPDYMDSGIAEEVPIPPEQIVPRAEPSSVEEETLLPDPSYRFNERDRRIVQQQLEDEKRKSQIDPIPSIPIQQVDTPAREEPQLHMPGPTPEGPTGDDKFFNAAIENELLDPDPSTWTPENVQAAEDAMQYNDPSGIGKFFGQKEGWALKPEPQQPPQPMDPNALGGLGSNIKGWGPLGVTLAQGIDRDEINYFKGIEEAGIEDMMKGIDVYDKGKIEARRMIDRSRRQGIMSLDNYVQSAQQRRAGQRAYDVMAMEQTPLSDLRFDMAKSALWKDIGGTRFKGDIYDATGATARDERLDKNRDAYYTALAENLTNLGTSMENRAAVLNQQKRNVILDDIWANQLDPNREPRTTGTCTPSDDPATSDTTAAACTDRACCESKGGTWIE